MLLKILYCSVNRKLTGPCGKRSRKELWAETSKEYCFFFVCDSVAPKSSKTSHYGYVNLYRLSTHNVFTIHKASEKGALSSENEKKVTFLKVHT